MTNLAGERAAHQRDALAGAPADCDLSSPLRTRCHEESRAEAKASGSSEVSSVGAGRFLSHRETVHPVLQQLRLLPKFAENDVRTESPPLHVDAAYTLG